MHPGLGERIRVARTHKFLTQKALGTILCLHKENISRWERGVGGPSPERMRDLCRILDVSAEWLVTGREVPVFPPDALEISITAVDWRLVLKIVRILSKRNLLLDKKARAIPAIYTWVLRRGDAALTDEAIDTILDSIPG